jgi:tRNA A37 methylthiotransferase MiaB
MYEAVRTYDITKLHAFPFSAHQKGETVPAGKLDGQVPILLKKDRMHRLMELGNTLKADFELRNRGIKRPVLLEKKIDTHRQ